MTSALYPGRLLPPGGATDAGEQRGVIYQNMHTAFWERLA